jgi:hypothetical protein
MSLSGAPIVKQKTFPSVVNPYFVCCRVGSSKSTSVVLAPPAAGIARIDQPFGDRAMYQPRARGVASSPELTPATITQGRHP